MQQTGDLIVGRFAEGKFSRAIDLDELKTILEGAGVNLSSIDFSGALRCVVTHDEQASTEQSSAAVVPTTRPVDLSSEASNVAPKTLREVLIAEVAERFQLSPESLQVRFSREDEKVLALSEGNCKIDVEPRKQRNIGDISWDVTVISATSKQKHTIYANVRAWQNQIIAVKPIAARQLIGDADVSKKR